MLSCRHFWAHMCLCMVGSYPSPSVCPSVTGPKVARKWFTSKKSFTYTSASCGWKGRWVPANIKLFYFLYQSLWHWHVGSHQHQVASLVPSVSLYNNWSWMNCDLWGGVRDFQADFTLPGFLIHCLLNVKREPEARFEHCMLPLTWKTAMFHRIYWNPPQTLQILLLFQSLCTNLK